MVNANRTLRELPDLKRLPALDLTGTTGRITRGSRESVVLLLVRDGALARARSYIGKLEDRLHDLRVWDTRVILVTENEPVESELPAANARPELWHALRIDDDRSALIIADRWSAVYFAKQTETFTDLPTPAEVEAWVRYLATQCPECGVIDEPGLGEWAP